MQRRNLKEEECFDRELWGKKMMSSGCGKLCIHRKIPIYVYIYKSLMMEIEKSSGMLELYSELTWPDAQNI
jgi:hypothetical protein